MTKRPEWKKLIVSILIPLAVGGAAALIANGSFKDFEALNKPPLAPPACCLLYTFSEPTRLVR